MQRLWSSIDFTNSTYSILPVFFLFTFIFSIVACAYLLEDVMYVWGRVTAEFRGGNHGATGAWKYHT